MASIILEKGSPRQHLAILRTKEKAGLQQMVRFWHKKYLPLHFKEGNANKYKYRRRSWSYGERKEREERRRGRKLPDLVWSGETKRSAESSITISGTANRAVGKMKAPNLNWQNLRGELVKTTRAEARRIVMFKKRIMDKNFSAATKIVVKTGV